MSEAKIGTFDELLEMAEAPVRPLLTACRALVHEIDPGVTEVVRLGDRAASWGVGPKKMTEGYCYAMPFASHVNLGFYQGASLPDPKQRLEGTGAKMRHVKVRSAADVEGCRALVKAALKERRATLGRG